MVGWFEVSSGGDFSEPAVEAALVKFDHPVAAGADEVVVSVAAEAVAALAGVVGEGIDDAVAGECVEGAVDGCESDPIAIGAEAAVEFGRRHVRAFGGEFLEDAQPLPGRLEPASSELPLEPTKAEDRTLRLFALSGNGARCSAASTSWGHGRHLRRRRLPHTTNQAGVSSEQRACLPEPRPVMCESCGTGSQDRGRRWASTHFLVLGLILALLGLSAAGLVLRLQGGGRVASASCSRVAAETIAYQRTVTRDIREGSRALLVDTAGFLKQTRAQDEVGCTALLGFLRGAQASLAAGCPACAEQLRRAGSAR